MRPAMILWALAFFWVLGGLVELLVLKRVTMAYGDFAAAALAALVAIVVGRMARKT